MTRRSPSSCPNGGCVGTVCPQTPRAVQGVLTDRVEHSGGIAVAEVSAPAAQEVIKFLCTTHSSGTRSHLRSVSRRIRSRTFWVALPRDRDASPRGLGRRWCAAPRGRCCRNGGIVDRDGGYTAQQADAFTPQIPTPITAGGLTSSSRFHSTAAMENNFGEGSEDDFHIQPKRPILDVKIVVAGPVCNRGVSS